MRVFARAAAVVLAAMLLASLAGAAPTGRDFLPVSDREAALFFPLDCNHPNSSVAGGSIHDRCAELGRDLFKRRSAGKVLYGSFTRE